MKKYFYPVLAAGMLFATSCSQDQELVDITQGEGQKMTFKVEIPSTESRAIKVGEKEVEIGKGNMATRLIYAQYERGTTKDATAPLVAGIVDDTDGDQIFTVDLTMAKDIYYDVLFMAYNPENNIFGISPEVDDAGAKDVNLKELTLRSDLKANQEAYDAFVGLLDNVNIKEEDRKEVVLKRPFAQVNAVVTQQDIDAAKTLGFEVTHSSFFIEDAPTTYNIFSGETDGETDLTYTIAPVFQTTTGNYETFANGQYYLTTAYVLAGDDEVSDKGMHDFKFKFYRGSSEENDCVSTLADSNLPIQRNHRTNVIGDLLTKTKEYTIIIDAEFDGSFVVTDLDYSYDEDTDTYTIYTVEGLNWFATQVDNGNTFEGQIIKLAGDIDLLQKNENGEATCFNPIGSYRNETAFKGTFDGQNHTISNLNQNTWALDNGYYYSDLGLGLFGMVEDATIKNLVMDNANISGESAMCGVVAAAAFGDMTFENITVKNSNCADYQYYSGGIVGWAAGNHQYINCNVDASTTVAAQWGDFDNSIGGVIGGASGSATILMKDCNVACRIDAYNDVTSSYQWYAYRRCGMLIGNTNNTEKVGDTTYAAAPQLTCENVTVTYGDWANYTYCEFAGTSWPYVRVQAGVSNSAYSNPRYGHPTDANGKEVVDDNHTHNDGEDHHILCAFDQLFGGGQGVYGLAKYEGVTVNYPQSYPKAVASKEELISAIEEGRSVVLSDDINLGTTQLAVDGPVTIDLGTHELSADNGWGIISLKEGASIKNGTINIKSNVAAIRAFNAGSIEDVTIKTAAKATGKKVTGIAVQGGYHVGSIKNVKIEGVTQGIELNEGAKVDLIENVQVDMKSNGEGTDYAGVGLMIKAGYVGKAVDCTFKGDVYGVHMMLKGEYNVGLELEDCNVEGTTAAIYAHDEKGISNTNNCSLTLTYDTKTTLTGPFTWNFEDECKSVVTLNKPE